MEIAVDSMDVVEFLGSGGSDDGGGGEVVKVPRQDRKSTRLNSSHSAKSRMPSSA